MATATAFRTSADDACVALWHAANSMTKMIDLFEQSSEWQSAYNETFCDIVCPSLANAMCALHTNSFQPPLLYASVAKLHIATQQLASTAGFMWPVTMDAVREKRIMQVTRALANPMAAACHLLHHTRINSAQRCVSPTSRRW